MKKNNTTASTDTYLTSDILIFRTLKTSQDSFLENFSIHFPSKDFLNQESNLILVANVDNEYKNKTMGSTEYKALTEVFIQTRQKDYIKASRVLKEATFRIKKILTNNEEFKKRNIIFRNNRADYNINLILRGRHLLIQTNEHEIRDSDYDDIVKCVKVEY